MTRDGAIRSKSCCRFFRSMLVGIPSDGNGVQTRALAQSIELALTTDSAVSPYVFAPRLSAPLPVSAATAPAWLAQEAERLEKFTSFRNARGQPSDLQRGVGGCRRTCEFAFRLSIGAFCSVGARP